MGDITQEQLEKYTSTSQMNEPARTNRKEEKMWVQMQEREGTLQSERFKDAISRKIFQNGVGGDTANDMEVAAQYELIKAITDGRVDFQDVGQAAGRPGYTYNSENTRDPTIGLPPHLAYALQLDIDAASMLNPRVCKRRRTDTAGNPRLMTGGGLTTLAKGMSLGTGKMEDGYATSSLPMLTSDYQQVDPVTETDPRYPSTRVQQVQGAHGNSLRNRLIPINPPGGVFGANRGGIQASYLQRGAFDAATIRHLMTTGNLGYEAYAHAQREQATNAARMAAEREQYQQQETTTTQQTASPTPPPPPPTITFNPGTGASLSFRDWYSKQDYDTRMEYSDIVMGGNMAEINNNRITEMYGNYLRQGQIK
jgi:hypothetical protein